MTQKQKKTAIIIGVILGVLLAAGITGSVLLKVSQPLYTKLSIALMPETLELKQEDGSTITFFIEQNKDYDKTKDDPIDAYKTYYMDGDKKVYLEGGVYMSGKDFAESKKADNQNKDDTQDGVKNNIGKGQMVTVGFLFAAQEKANKLQGIITAADVVFALCCVAYLIYLWYLSWSRRQDKKEQELAAAQQKLQGKSE